MLNNTALCWTLYHKPHFTREETEAKRGRMMFAREPFAGRARNLFREHLGVTQCLLLSM